MPTRSWKNWSLFIVGLCILFLPYIGFPQPIKNALFILFGLLIIVVAGSQLWPYHDRHQMLSSARKISPRRHARKQRAVEPLADVMPSELVGMPDIPHDTTQ